MLVSVQTITDSAIDLADMRNSKFVNQSGLPGSELIRYANMAYKDLYNQIVNAHDHYFTIPFTINLVNGNDTYALPPDFYKLSGVDLLVDGGGGVGSKFLTMRSFAFAERNKYRTSLITQIPYWKTLRYLLVQNNIKFIPIPTQTSVVQMWYTPEPTTIVSLSDILQVEVGGDEYMSLYIACAMLAKEESDNSALNAKRIEVINQLINLLRNRDEGEPKRIIDEDELNAGALFPWGGISY